MCIIVVNNERNFRMHFKIFTPLIREFIKGVRSSYAITSTSSMKMFYHVVHSGVKPVENFLEAF